jgi:hypothetical protein
MLAGGRAFESVIITRPDPHCIGWACATASLWGMADGHDLDEPVILTDMVPVRLRYEIEGENIRIVADRTLTMKTIRAGHHAALRFYFKNGSFFETDIPGARSIGHADQKVEITKC